MSRDVWIIRTRLVNDKKLRLYQDSERFLWNWINNPEGHVRFLVRKPNEWEYVAYGFTPEQCVANFNYYAMLDIRELESKLAEKKSKLLRIEDAR